MTDTAHDSQDAGTDTSRIESEQEADQRADLWGVFIIFSMLVLGAVHFVSGGLL